MSVPLTTNLDATISSFGGVGTSFLMHFFKQYIRINCSHNTDYLKHIDTPPLTHKINFRAVYIYGNPIEATVSLFKRNYHSVHSKYLLRSHPKIEPISKQDDLENYLNRKTDKFKFETHFEQWLHSKRHYPILFLKYEYLWDYLPELFDFLEIERKYIYLFPNKKKRTSKLDEILPENLSQLNNMYGKLVEQIEQYPAFFIKSPTPGSYFNSLIELPLSLANNLDSIHPAITFSTFYPKTYNFLKHLLMR